MRWFRYHNTNCFFIESTGGRYLAFDAGWPCTLYEYKRMLKTIDIKYEDISLVVISHMHMDHAGLLTDFQKSMIECCVTKEQLFEIDAMERIILRNREYEKYERINKNSLTVLGIEEINELLMNNKIMGQIIETKGHSEDSISFVTYNYEVLIGDLALQNQIMEDALKSMESWKMIRGMNVKSVYPSHAERFLIEENG